MCAQSAKSPFQLNQLRNYFVSHANITLKCNVCSSVFRSEQSYRNHCLTHFKNPSICEECYKVFALKTSLKNHMRVHTGVKDICSEVDCGKSFASHEKYLEHVQYAHLDEKTSMAHVHGLFPNPFKPPLSFRSSS